MKLSADLGGSELKALGIYTVEGSGITDVRSSEFRGFREFGLCLGNCSFLRTCNKDPKRYPN